MSVRVPPHIEPVLREIGRIAQDARLPAYAVGGCVRDWMLGRWRTEDLDVTVEGDGIALAGAAGRALGGEVTVHKQFGTATLTVPGRGRVDFASCRRETYARPAAYPRVEPGTLNDDLFRRDFTINAMAMAITSDRFMTLVDPFGGARDLGQKVLRVLHDQSFADDPSRILRGIRFRHRFGLQWEARTLQQMQEAVKEGMLGLLNAGRLSKELERMGAEPNPLACLDELAAVLGGAKKKRGRRRK